jgi:hypothetical protein
MGEKQLGMTFALRLLTVMFWLGASIGAGTAQSSEEDLYNSVLKVALGDVEISCDTLAIAEFDDEESAFKSGVAPRRIDFDPVTCAGLLKPTQFGTYVKPFFDSLAKWSLDQDLLKKTLESETAADRKKREEQESQELDSMQDSLQRNTAPLVSICRELGRKSSDRSVRVCYFGAPRASAGLPFKKMFQSIFDETLSEVETVCGPDPITHDKAIVPEIRGLLDTREESLSWSQLHESMRIDGFKCWRDDGCGRGLIKLVVKPELKSENGPLSNWHSSNDATFIPEQFSIYKGYWMKRLLGGTCSGDDSNQFSDQCKGPSRGSAKGICISGLDWLGGPHGWNYVIGILNNWDERP